MGADCCGHTYVTRRTNNVHDFWESKPEMTKTKLKLLTLQAVRSKKLVTNYPPRGWYDIIDGMVLRKVYADIVNKSICE